MIIGPKFKIARRLGAAIFEKTQTVKYAQSQARKEKNGKSYSRPKSEFGTSLIEKQKARLTYGLSERQFRSYVEKALKTANPSATLFKLLETRLDNVIYRAGLAKSRSAGRQIATHGHTTVGGHRVDVPSIHLGEGDTVSLRKGSAGSPLFADSVERMKAITPPAWLLVEPELRTVKVVGEPVYEANQNVFDLGVVIGFYNR